MKTETLNKKLIARLHMLAKQAGMNDDDYRDYLYNNYQVTTSTLLTTAQLREACNCLQKIIDNEANTWRRRVMAAIGAYLRRQHLNENAQYIKAIACRAADCSDFNTIPVARLRAIYYEFVRRNKITENIDYEIINLKYELSKLN
jgi:hypothetical protein